MFKCSSVVVPVLGHHWGKQNKTTQNCLRELSLSHSSDLGIRQGFQVLPQEVFLTMRGDCLSGLGLSALNFSASVLSVFSHLYADVSLNVLAAEIVMRQRKL